MKKCESRTVPGTNPASVSFSECTEVAMDRMDKR